MLDRIKGAVEHDDHFAIDDGSGRPFRVAKSALSPAMTDRVRRMFAGGVARMADGGMVDPALMAGTVAEEPVDKLADMAPPEVVIPPPLPVEVSAPVEVPVLPALVEPVVGPPVPAAATEVGPPAPIAPSIEPVAVVEPIAAPAPVTAPVEAVPTAPAAPVVEAPLPLPAAVDVGAKVTAGIPTPVGATQADVEAVAPLVRIKAERAVADEQLRRVELQIAQRAEQARAAEQEAANKEVQDLAAIAEQNKSALSAARADYDRKAQALRDSENARVETDQLWKGEYGGVAQFFAGFAMFAGGIAAGMTGTQNTAEQVIDRAIARNIEQQRADITMRRANRLSEYQAAGLTVDQASKLVKADLDTLAAARARATGARQASVAARDAFQRLAASYQSKALESVESAINDISASAVTASVARRGLEKENLAIAASRQALQAGALGMAKTRQEMALAQQAARRADIELALRGQEAATKARAEAADASVLGRVGKVLTPEQWGSIKDNTERESYVVFTDDQGNQGYRRAITRESAAELRDLDVAVSRGLENARGLGQLVKAINPNAPTILPGTEAKTRSEALQQEIVKGIKDIERLGALTASDMGLVTPTIPDPQSWTSTDAQEAEKVKQLTTSFRLLRKLALKNKLVLSADERKAVEDEVKLEVEAIKGGAVAPEPAAPVAPARTVLGTTATGAPVHAGEPSAPVPGLGSLLPSRPAYQPAVSPGRKAVVQQQLAAQREASARIRGEK